MRQYWNAREFPGQFFEQAIRALLCLLLLALLGAILAGAAQTFRDLWPVAAGVFGEREHGGFRQVLVDALTVLAMVEVFRTALAYFAEGRVKVTYIIDTVMVAVLTEVLAFWHRELETTRLVMAVILVVALMLVRILAIQFSPNRAETADGL
jgi:uncharacterized membrane protein (DUF373 family)